MYGVGESAARHDLDLCPDIRDHAGGPAGPLWAIRIIGSLATPFALLGGMRGVIWTDVLQFGILLSGLITVIVLGLLKSGGVSHVFQTGLDTGRFRFPDFFGVTEDLSLL